MKLFKKTALAAALSVVAAGPVLAATSFTFTGGDETIVLADVIFGNGNPGVGSEETLITAPEVTFDLDSAGTGGDTQNGTAGTATVKFTLGGFAVFGEDLSTTALADNANAGAGVFSLTQGANVDTALTYEVVQGGAIGDNTITFEITFGADTSTDGETLQAMTFTGYKVKNLTGALNPSSTNKRVQLAVEYVEADDAADFGGASSDEIDLRATSPAVTIFGSQEPFVLASTAVDFLGTAPFTRINVGNGELKLTGGTADGRSDFDPTGDVTLVNLGTLKLDLQGVDTVAFPGTTGKVRKENGDDQFDFNANDAHTLNFSVVTGQMQEGSTVFLNENADCVTGTPFSTNTLNADELRSFPLVVSGDTNELTTLYNVCYQVTSTTVIPEVGGIKAAWDIDFFNTRYDNVDLEAGPYGDLVRNGCIASFFNVPASTNNDRAYIRLTNTSVTNEGDIRGTLYAENGDYIGEPDTTIAPDLAIHATQVFSTEAATRDGASDKQVISIEEAFGIGPEDIAGRARLILKGAFDTCEGLGLLRTGDGSLFNMTATTQGNEAAAPNDGNNGN